MEAIPRLEAKIVILEAERLLVEEQVHALQTQVDVERKARVDCEEGLQRTENNVDDKPQFSTTVNPTRACEDKSSFETIN